MKSNPLGVVVGASDEALHAIEVAQGLGVRTLALDGNPAAAGLAAADEAAVVDIRSTDCLEAALGDRRPDVVVPVPIGRWLISGAWLNDRYDLPGIRQKAAVLCTDKWAFHRALAGTPGLREADCLLLHEKKDLEACAALSLPLILKPRYGSGSRGVLALRTHAALDAALAALPFEEDMLLETEVPGQEYGLDAAVIGGQFYPVLLRKKINTPPPYCQCVGYSAVLPGDGFWAAAVDAVRRAAALLGLDNTVLHADVMQAADGRPFLIEMSPRPSGHHLHNLFTPAVTGVDLVGQYLAFALGKPYSFAVNETKCAMIRFFDFANCTVLQTPQEKALRADYPLLAYRCEIRSGDTLGPVRDGGVMHRGYFILTGRDEAELTRQAARLLEEFTTRPLPTETAAQERTE